MGRDVVADRARTAAISLYVADHRPELLKHLPEQAKVDKNVKRTELLRLGRSRFCQEAPEAQREYLQRATGRAGSRRAPSVGHAAGAALEPDGSCSAGLAPGGAEALGRSGVRERDLAEHDPVASQGSGASPAQVAGDAGDALASAGAVAPATPSAKRGSEQSPCPVLKRARPSVIAEPQPSPRWSATLARRAEDDVVPVLSCRLALLQRIVGVAAGAEVLAAGYRIARHASAVAAPSQVKVAAILGLAVKLNQQVGKGTIGMLWFSVAGPGAEECVAKVERDIFERMAKDGLVGDCATGGALTAPA